MFDYNEKNGRKITTRRHTHTHTNTRAGATRPSKQCGGTRHDPETEWRKRNVQLDRGCTTRFQATRYRITGHRTHTRNEQKKQTHKGKGKKIGIRFEEEIAPPPRPFRRAEKK